MPTPSWPAASPRPAQSIGDVVLPDNELRRIAALCAAFDVDGMRADLVVARTAVAHAAWRGAQTVGEEDIRVAAELALPHRRRRDPFDDPGLDPQQLDEAMAQTQDQADDPIPTPTRPAAGGSVRRPIRIIPAPQGNSSDRQARPSAAPSGVFRTRTLVVPGVGEGAPGRRSRARNRTGTPVSSTSEPEAGHGVHVFAHCWPPRVDSSGRAVRGRNPTTYGARSGKAAKAIW